MWYGFDKKQFISGLKIFVVIGLFATIAGFLSTFFSENKGDNNYWALLFLALVVPAIWLILSAIFCSTWVKVNDSIIYWYLFKIWLLKKVPIKDITRVRGGSFSAVVIETSQGNIHIIGLDIPTREKLGNHLLELASETN